MSSSVYTESVTNNLHRLERQGGHCHASASWMESSSSVSESSLGQSIKNFQAVQTIMWAHKIKPIDE